MLSPKILKIKKSIDVIIYYRTHSNKNNKFIIKLVEKLTKKNKNCYYRRQNKKSQCNKLWIN